MAGARYLSANDRRRGLTPPAANGQSPSRCLSPSLLLYLLVVIVVDYGLRLRTSVPVSLFFLAGRPGLRGMAGSSHPRCLCTLLNIVNGNPIVWSGVMAFNLSLTHTLVRRQRLRRLEVSHEQPWRDPLTPAVVAGSDTLWGLAAHFLRGF